MCLIPWMPQSGIIETCPTTLVLQRHTDLYEEIDQWKTGWLEGRCAGGEYTSGGRRPM
jgi:hypothetical protein